MLSPKQNFYEAAKGLNPDRYANQYEALRLVLHPALLHLHGAQPGEENVVNAWGITNSWPAGMPGAFPVHTPDKIVIKDIEHWQDYVHAPSLKFPQELWDVCKGMYAGVDGSKSYKATFIAPGLFEQTHHLSEMQNALMYYMEYPDEMHDLIKYLTDWEMELAEGICSNLHPDAIFHHDDWGSETNSFLRPSQFEDYFLEGYKAIYDYYHDHGVELVIHHSDSYAANLVPDMIEMGINVWQGPMHTNNVPELVKKYGDKITFMGEIDNKFVDFEGWTVEDCQKAALDAIERVGTKKGFIPCITQGGPGSVYPGTYRILWETIDKYNIEHFGCTQEELDANRPPRVVMFGAEEKEPPRHRA
jgi:hypothetical protein